MDDTKSTLPRLQLFPASPSFANEVMVGAWTVSMGKPSAVDTPEARRRIGLILDRYPKQDIETMGDILSIAVFGRYPDAVAAKQ